MNMSTYPGLPAATRESVSLDEDELSDVEDEVFIRDGRNGYKLAEERGVKRPLMAPRRKINKPDLTSRLKNRPPCRMLCIPCCYAFIALTIFLGLIVVVIVLVAIFPMPLDTVKSWIVSKTGSTKPMIKSIPCTDLDISDVWTVSVPKLGSESAMRSLDVNGDGVDDIVFGYGLDEDVPLPQQWFCPMFLGVKPPCQGGVQAIDGQSGATLWQRRLPHSVFTLHCTADLSADNVTDCLASGKGGVLSAVSGRDGSLIWEFLNNVTSLVVDVYSASFIPDLNSDGVQDVLAAHTIQAGGNRSGFLLVISGKTGIELSRVSTPNNTEILYAPQLFTRQGSDLLVLFGTGSENTPGALHMASLNDIYAKHMNSQILYTDPFKGVQSPVVLVDLNGDQQEDIVSAMFNSTIVAIDGKTLLQLWNFTVNNSETLSTPTPGYFTSDNVTDFLIKYQTGPEFPVYYYSQTIIIDGKTGKPIYNRPLVDSVGSQMGGLTISMDNHGNDMFIYWMADCKNYEGRQDTFSFDKISNIRQKSKADLCKLRYNSSMVTKLYSLNQYNEPPGILLYTSENRTSLEFNNSKTPLEEFNLYLQQNPDFDFNLRNDHSMEPEDVANNYDYKNMNFKMKIPGNINRGNNFNYKNVNYKGGISNFRHRDNDQGLVKDFSRDDARNKINKNDQPAQPDDKYSDYDQSEGGWAPSSSVDELLDPQLDYPETYADESDHPSPLNTNMKTIQSFNGNNRDPRSKPQIPEPPELSQLEPQPSQNPNDKVSNQKSKKKNLAQEEYGPNDYKNVYMARNRLLHDLNDLPSEILRDTYVKHRETQIRNNKFEQRDLRFREHEDDDGNKTEDVASKKFPESLWDLESEKELEDRENGYWRGKREAEKAPEGIYRMTSTGLLLKPLSYSGSQNAIDLVFATYWVYPKKGAYVLSDKDQQCIRQKILDSTSPTDKFHSLEKSTKEDLFTKMCLEERGVLLKQKTNIDQNNDMKKSPYYNQISQLSLGQMTIYRLRLQCKCQLLKPDETCAQILPEKDQFWPSYMGRNGDGQFKTH